MAKRLVVTFLMAGFVLFGALGVQAQEMYTAQDAIDLAAKSPYFQDSLATYSGWTAAAYDTENAYGIWHVQFRDSEGEDLGWADVNPARERVYAWESHMGATEALRDAAYPILRDFIASQPEITELVPDPAAYDMYVDYNGWVKAWGIYLDRGQDSLYMIVQFEGKMSSSLENPQLIDIGFPEVLSYDEWKESNQALVIAAAFQNSEVADALSGVDDWTTSVDKLDEGLWQVDFMQDGNLLARVTVDLTTETVVDFEVGS